MSAGIPLELQIKALEREITVHEVDRILIQVAGKAGEAAIMGQTIDTMPYAKKIVAFLREHLR